MVPATEAKPVAIKMSGSACHQDRSTHRVPAAARSPGVPPNGTSDAIDRVCTSRGDRRPGGSSRVPVPHAPSITPTANRCEPSPYATNCHPRPWTCCRLHAQGLEQQTRQPARPALRPGWVRAWTGHSTGHGGPWQPCSVLLGGDHLAPEAPPLQNDLRPLPCICLVAPSLLKYALAHQVPRVPGL